MSSLKTFLSNTRNHPYMKGLTMKSTRRSFGAFHPLTKPVYNKGRRKPSCREFLIYLLKKARKRRMMMTSQGYIWYIPYTLYTR